VEIGGEMKNRRPGEIGAVVFFEKNLRSRTVEIFIQAGNGRID
jgi:hypothetical protein